MGTSADQGRQASAWARAAALARNTPEARNRYADFLRAASIGAVVLGHWVMAAPAVVDGKLRVGHMLDLEPWTYWLTWVFQVMPVFFIVGGFSNGISWGSAQRTGKGYSTWLDGRLRRLVGPVLTLILGWVVIAVVLRSQGVGPQMIRVGSQMALIPIWFLAVYVMVVVLVPVTHAAWKRWGFSSFWTLAAGAVLIDVAFFAADLRLLGWINYVFVWLAVHQLGYAWGDGRLAGPRRALPWALGGLAALVGLVTLGPYPISMVGVPGDTISNTQPPKVTLLALAALQGGLLLALEPAARRWLARGSTWTLTVLVNSMIMTIYLWHLTALTLLVGLASLLGGIGLGLVPGTGAWWSARPPWMIVLAAATSLFVMGLARFERPRAGPERAAAPSWRLVVGSALVCTGLAMLALDGIGGEGWLGLRPGVLATTFAGALLMQFNPGARRFRTGC